MLRLRFLSTTSLALLASVSGCGDDDCGPGSAPDKGLVAGSSDVQLVFGSLISGTNNDCPDPQAPEGVISLTISGTRTDGSGIVTLCVPRPDLLPDGVPLGASGVRVIDLNAEADGCMFSLESARPTSGTVTATGLCDAGASSEGFALSVDGNVSLKRDCPTASDTIAVSFAGTVAVTVP